MTPQNREGQHSPEEEVLEGNENILKYIARVQNGLYPPSNDALEAVQAEDVVNFAASHLVAGAGLEGACTALNTYLSGRTVFIGHTVTIADIAVWGALQATPAWLKLRRGLPHLVRWFEHVAQLPAMKETLDQVGVSKSAKSKATSDGSKNNNNNNNSVKNNNKSQRGSGKPNSKGTDAGGSFDIDLPGAEMGKVVTRFPPEPSGYLHIGHAKAALLNQEIADRFDGKLLVRFDDTNPSKEKDEYVENIVNDIQRLGLRFEKITYTSDYFPQLLECAEKLIAEGLAYADDTPVDKMREERMAGVESRCRVNTVEENMRAWAEMKAGSEKGTKYCIRIKMDMSAANKALRDPVIYRCNSNHHWRTGHRYKCYPTYDFACPMVDAIEGVTHALRTSEYKDREAQFYWMLKLQQSVWPGLPNVHIWDYARLSFIYTVLSKRKLTWFVEQGLVEGWDDPRMPTVQGMLRRGLQLEALKEFIISQGASKNTTFQEWDKIWTMNKKVIDPVCPRHTAVELDGRVSVTLQGGPDPQEVVEVPRHPKYPPAGMKKQLRSTLLWLDQQDALQLVQGEEVTLMAWGNAKIDKIQRSASNAEGKEVVEGVNATLHLEGDFKKTKLKLTWLAASDECPPIELHYFGYLITKKKLEEEDEFEEFVNKETRWVVKAVGDANMKNLAKGDVIQLERKGYFIVDVPFNGSDPIILFNIPDGRAKNLAPTTHAKQ